MDEDCMVDAEIPVKEKKLKQARLPFQILSESPKTGKSEKESSPATNKKRKLSSPSPVQNKSSKIIKITSKENDTVDLKDNGNGPADITDDNDKSDVERKKAKIADKKTEPKTETKSNLMTRFLVRTDKDTKKTENSPKRLEKTDKDDTKKKSSNEDSSSKKDQDEVMVVDVDAEEKSSKKDAEEDDDSESPEVDKKISKSDIGSPASKPDESKDKDKEESDEKNISANSSSDEEEELEVSQTEDLETSSQMLSTPSSVTKKKATLDRKKMTPKQLQKQLEKEKRLEERQKLRLEKERKKEEEEKKKREEKELKRKEKEKERREKEQKRKEKEEKQKEKEALEKKKEEERRKKKEAKEEEEKKKMEEKLELERKKQKAASNFIGFFVAKKPETKSAEDKQANKFTNFMPFEVKTDMKIAPIIRRELSDEEKVKLDELRAKNDAKKSHLYLKELKSDDFVIRRSPKTFPLEMKDEDIVIIEEEDEGESVVETPIEEGPIEKHRPKLLYFHENRRPPYWGTWRKKSETINPRRPFAQDNKWFDYEIDSDDEWEEEEPGESLHGSDDEKDKDEENNPEENEYDVDNEFMVPHGYLSDEEVREDEEEEEDMSPETQKFKLKVLGDEFEAERNEKTLKLKPKVIGCIWTNEHGTLPESTSSRITQLLTARQAWVCETPININAAPDVDNRHASENPSAVPNNAEKSSRKKKEVPDEAVPHLIRLLHGNIHNRHDLAKEFIEFLKQDKTNSHSATKRSFLNKLRELATWMACPEEGPMFQKHCWYVSKDIRKQYLGDEKLELPNKWEYILTPKRRPEKEEPEEKKASFPLITQFAKNMTHEEMKKQLQEPKSSPSTPTQQKPMKRATLISVPRGEQLPKSPRVSLLDKFVAAASKKDSASASKVTDDVVTIEDD